VYAVQQTPPNYTNTRSQPHLIDAAVVKSAGDIYRVYCEVHPEMTGHASGVAINRFNHRGKVIFTPNPVLLPQECFVPLAQIESFIY
jgi:hypothetical protein